MSFNYYTVYKDDEVIAFGTAEQCTKKLELKNIRQFYALVSKAKSGLRSHYVIVTERITDSDDHIKKRRQQA